MTRARLRSERPLEPSNHRFTLSGVPDTYASAVQILQLVERVRAARGRPVEVNALADHFGVHRRTVLRWVDALGRAWPDEPPVIREHRDGRAWLRAPTDRTALPRTVFQLAAVRLALRHLEAQGQSVITHSATDVLDAMWSELPSSELARRVDRAFHYVAFAPKRYEDQDDVLDPLLRAVLFGRQVRLDYRPLGGGETQHTLEPYTLVAFRDGLYVVGRRIGLHAGLRTYAVDRIAAVALEDTRFEVPEDYDVRDAVGAMGMFANDAPAVDARIAFDAEVGRGLQERTLPGDPTWTERPDGRLQLDLTVQITPEVWSWLLSFGATAEVLAPEELRRDLQDELRSAAARYR